MVSQNSRQISIFPIRHQLGRVILNVKKVIKCSKKRPQKARAPWVGFKLDFIINPLGEIMNFTITSSTTDNCKLLLKGLQKWLFANTVYIGEELMKKLKVQAVELFTKVKKNR